MPPRRVLSEADWWGANVNLETPAMALYANVSVVNAVEEFTDLRAETNAQLHHRAVSVPNEQLGRI